MAGPVAAAGPVSAAFDLKNTTLPLLQLQLKSHDLAALAAELEARRSETPHLFLHDPLVVDLSALRELEEAAIDFPALAALLREHRLQPVAVANGNASQLEAALEAGLPEAPEPPAPKPRPVYSAPLSALAYKAPNTRTASYQPAAKDSGDAPVFVWPVSGNVISNFGAVSSGERNDGINIASEAGTPIHAAAAGTVTYSGNELKDYGNLALIKHDGGYVTAYAHADKLIVNRGDYVTKGQVIGYVGSTGDVSTPQLHFEIRQGRHPLNPLTLLPNRS